MTLLKLLATALVALSFMVIALPGYAANDGDGVTGSAPNGTQDPAAARPRRITITNIGVTASGTIAGSRTRTGGPSPTAAAGRVG